MALIIWPDEAGFVERKEAAEKQRREWQESRKDFRDSMNMTVSADDPRGLTLPRRV